MRAVIQRVSEASVTTAGRMEATIGNGLLVLLGIEEADSVKDVQWLVRKISQLRIFPDDGGRMNRALKEIGGEVLVVSQFTLHASYRKGNRPSFTKAARPERAVPLYQAFLEEMERTTGRKTASGTFGAHMSIDLVNDGPVTICMDSQRPE